MGSYDFCLGHPLECPQKMGEDLRKGDVAADLRRNMYVRQREQCQCPLTLADSEPHNECNHSPNWVTVGKAKQRGE